MWYTGDMARKEKIMRLYRNRFAATALMLVMGAGLAVMTGCGKTETDKKETAVEEKTTSAEEAVSGDEKVTAGDDKADSGNDKVASGDETVAAIDVVQEGMVPVKGDQVKDGEYTVKVDSSSSMFKIVSCRLTVEDGSMTAVLTMSGTAYTKLYLGTASQAADAKEEDCVMSRENENGEVTFTIPVEALDQGIDCAAFSKNKEKWYDRVLVFRLDSLPSEAVSETLVTSVSDLGLKDGEYTVEVALKGGSGRAGVTSPTPLKVEGDQATAVITFSSPNYDYMIVDGKKYEPVNAEGNSTFEIPVAGFDFPMAVTADTTAMSKPHEIEYTLTFDSKSIR